MPPGPAPSRTLVTGGTRGIGAAVVRRLARTAHGGPVHEVVALGRAPSTAPAWLEQLGPHAAAVQLEHAEASDPAQVEAAFARGGGNGAGYTGLVASAGIWEPTPIVAADPAAFRRVLEVNVLGVVHAVAAFVRRARPGVTKSIVLVGSTAGQRGEAGYSAYAASKAALAGLCKSWAVELAPLGIRVNVVAPGWVDTEMTAHALGDPERRARIEAEIPRGRVASAEDVAGPVVFLLGEDAAHVTGSVVSVNGGAVLASY